MGEFFVADIVVDLLEIFQPFKVRPQGFPRITGRVTTERARVIFYRVTGKEFNAVDLPKSISLVRK